MYAGAIDPRAVAFLHADLDAGAVLDGTGGEGDRPDAVLVLLEVRGVGVPVVEVADEDSAARGGAHSRKTISPEAVLLKPNLV